MDNLPTQINQMFKCERRRQQVPCGAQFSSMDGLMQHDLLFHEVYRCAICTKTFVTLGKLRKHSRKVHTEKYRCHQCDFVRPMFAKRAIKLHKRFHDPLLAQLPNATIVSNSSVPPLMDLTISTIPFAKESTLGSNDEVVANNTTRLDQPMSPGELINEYISSPSLFPILDTDLSGYSPVRPLSPVSEDGTICYDGTAKCPPSKVVVTPGVQNPSEVIAPPEAIKIAEPEVIAPPIVKRHSPPEKKWDSEDLKGYKIPKLKTSSATELPSSKVETKPLENAKPLKTPKPLTTSKSHKLPNVNLSSVAKKLPSPQLDTARSPKTSKSHTSKTSKSHTSKTSKSHTSRTSKSHKTSTSVSATRPAPKLTLKLKRVDATPPKREMKTFNLASEVFREEVAFLKQVKKGILLPSAVSTTDISFDEEVREPVKTHTTKPVENTHSIPGICTKKSADGNNSHNDKPKPKITYLNKNNDHKESKDNSDNNLVLDLSIPNRQRAQTH